MKKYFLIILLLQAVNVFALVPLKKGDVLNVWATHGLSFYQKPETNSKKLSTIAYGAVVTVTDADIEAKPKSISFETTGEEKSITLRSDWVKVKYNSLEGYVLNVYLSTMPCFKKVGTEFELEDAYLKRIYGEPKVIVKKTNVKNMPQLTTTKNYKGGIVQTELLSDGCFDVHLYLNNVSYQDGVLFEQTSLFSPDAATNIKVKNAKSGKVDISYCACD